MVDNFDGDGDGDANCSSDDDDAMVSPTRTQMVGH